MNYLDKFKELFCSENDNVFLVENLEGGMSNINYVFSKNNQYYVMRFPKENSELYVNRIEEFDMLENVKNVGIIPKTFYINKDSGIKISEFVIGNSINRLEPKKYIKDVSVLLHKLHSCKLTNHYYNAFEKLEKYESYIKEISKPKFQEKFE